MFEIMIFIINIYNINCFIINWIIHYYKLKSYMKSLIFLYIYFLTAFNFNKKNDRYCISFQQLKYKNFKFVDIKINIEKSFYDS